MVQSAIDRPVINSPYEEPAWHWRYGRETRLFGRWRWAVARQPGDIRDILAVTTPVVAGGS